MTGSETTVVIIIAIVALFGIGALLLATRERDEFPRRNTPANEAGPRRQPTDDSRSAEATVRDLIDAYANEDGADVIPGEAAPKAFAALRALLELHHPDGRAVESCATCREIYFGYPCPTIAIITIALEAA